MDPEDIVIDLGVRPRDGGQPPAGDPPPLRARIRWRPWLMVASLAALLVLVAGSATLPGGHGVSADPLPTDSSAPNLNQLNELDQQYRMYGHGPIVSRVPHEGADKTQWCWIEQSQTGEMSLVPCPGRSAPPPITKPGYPPGD